MGNSKWESASQRITSRIARYITPRHVITSYIIITLYIIILYRISLHHIKPHDLPRHVILRHLRWITSLHANPRYHRSTHVIPRLITLGLNWISFHFLDRKQTNLQPDKPASTEDVDASKANDMGSSTQFPEPDNNNLNIPKDKEVKRVSFAANDLQEHIQTTSKSANSKFCVIM